MALLEVFATQGRFLVDLEKLGADHGVETLTFGRSQSVELTIDGDPDVSRRHGQLSSVAGQWAIEDLGARNGTWVNGDRLVGRRILRNGDEIRVGGTTMGFRDPTNAESSTNKRAPAPKITDRERDVLVELCWRFFSGGRRKQAATRAEIARALFLGDPAVQAHLLHLYDKFGIVEGARGERRDLLAVAVIERGVIGPGDYADREPRD